MPEGEPFAELVSCASEAEGQALKSVLVQAGIPARMGRVQRGVWQLRVAVSRIAEARRTLAEAEQAAFDLNDDFEIEMADLTTCASERDAAGIERILADRNIGAVVVALTSESHGVVVVRVPADRLDEAREAIGSAQEN